MKQSTKKDIGDVFKIIFQVLGGIVCASMIIVGFFMVFTGKPQIMYYGRKWLNDLWDLGWNID